MNMKKYVLWTFIIGLMGLAACSDDAGLDNPNPTNPELPEGEVMLRASIKLPGTDAVSYATIAQDDELVIDTISAFVFAKNTDGKYILNKITRFAQGDVKNEQGVDDGSMLQVGSEFELGVIIRNTELDYKFYFIANASEVSSLKEMVPNRHTEDNFLVALSNAAVQGIRTANGRVNPLMMTTDSVSITSAKLLEPNPRLENLEFRRVAARIDIVNFEKTLAIDKVEFLNTPERSLVFNKALVEAVGNTPAVWTFAENLDGSTVKRKNLPTVTIADTLRFPPNFANTTTAGKDSVHLKSLFFPYEGYIKDSTDTYANTSVRIWGRYMPKAVDGSNLNLNSGTEVVYTLDLNAGNTTTKDKAQLLRNHRYVLQIEGTIGDDLKYTFKVNEWNHNTDTDTVPKVMDPEIKFTYRNNAFVNLPITMMDSSYQIDVKSPTKWKVEVSYLDDASSDWLNAAGGITPEQNSYSSIGDFFKLTAKANKTGYDRSATVRIISEVDKIDEETEFTVVQYSNPLARFAKGNLKTVNAKDWTDIADGTAAKLEANYGFWFQWGRNVAFANNATPVTPNENLVSFENGNNGTNTDFIGGTGVTVWYNETVSIDDIWYKLANSTYTNTDPCPATYRLPTADDWLTVAPAKDVFGAYATANDTVISGALEMTGNQITIETSPSSYKGAGNDTGYKTVFGVKTVNGQKLAYRWRYYATDLADPTDAYLEIACMPALTTAATATLVSAYTDADWSAANGVEVRYFPAAGNLSVEGRASNRGFAGLYWSSAVNTTAAAWNLSFSNSTTTLFSNSRGYGFSVRCVAEQ